jgi:hypothetical protein
LENRLKARFSYQIQGTHDNLVKAGGRYSRMWEQYTGAVNWTLAKA